MEDGVVGVWAARASSLRPAAHTQNLNLGRSPRNHKAVPPRSAGTLVLSITSGHNLATWTSVLAATLVTSGGIRDEPITPEK